MGGEWHWRRLRPAIATWRPARVAAWTTATGIALSSVTIVVSALNTVTTQQAIALAVPAVLITVGGLAFRVVPDAWIAWRRGFRHGCQAAATSETCLTRADDAGSSFGQIRLVKVTTYPAARYCAVCGRGDS
jgi:hypothetical protein